MLSIVMLITGQLLVIGIAYFAWRLTTEKRQREELARDLIMLENYAHNDPQEAERLRREMPNMSSKERTIALGLLFTAEIRRQLRGETL